MKKRLFKNGFALVISLMMVLSLIPMTGAASAPTADANGFYPTAVYSDASAFDANGKWIYRELAVGGDCEDADDLALVWNNGSTSVTASELSTTIKHSGNASIKQTFSATYQYVGLPVDELIENENYRFSYYLYPAEKIDANVLTNRLAYGRVGKTSVGQTEVKYDKSLAAATWNFIDATIHFVRSDTTEIDTAKPMYAAFTTNKKELYLDDMSVRRIPEFTVNQIGKALSSDGKTVTFTFDKDIDSRMAVAENIVATGATVSSIAVSTNAITRETTMAVTFTEAVALDRVSYTEALTDAWGRAINVKEEKLSFDTPVLSGSTFSVSNIENYSGKTVKLAAIIAAYDSTGKCTEVKFDAFTMENNTTKAQLSASLEGAASSVKAFVWDMNTLVPYYINQ